MNCIRAKLLKIALTGLVIVFTGCGPTGETSGTDPNNNSTQYSTCGTALVIGSSGSHSLFLGSVAYLGFDGQKDQTIRLKFDFHEGLNFTAELQGQSGEASQPVSPGQIIEYILSATTHYCVKLTLVSEPGGDIQITVNPTDGQGNPLGSGSIDALAEVGMPTDQTKPCANVGQAITVYGSGLTTDSIVTFRTVDSGGLMKDKEVKLASAQPDGTGGTVVVPDEAATASIVLPGGKTAYLQIVPKVTGISGGTPGLTVTINGSGFIEGATTVRFGADDATVVDGGTAEDDGINVQTSNKTLITTVPANGTLPYEVITQGGRTGRAGDLTGIPADATLGVPTDTALPSGNAHQTISLIGTGFSTNSKITFHTIDESGGESISTVAPVSVADDGLSMTVVVPDKAKTAKVGLLSGREGIMLQIVPTIGSITGGTPGQQVTINGSGFVEGGTTVRFGSDSQVVQDGGKAADDGLDIQSSNKKLVVNVPANGTLPYEIVTAGGRSNIAGRFTGLDSQALRGTPTDPNEASANPEQIFSLTGDAFNDGTRVLFPTIDQYGQTAVTTVVPSQVAADGKSLTVKVPLTAETGMIAILDGRERYLLQIVPEISSMTFGGPGLPMTIKGQGFVEGKCTVRFGTDQVTVTDTGIASGDVIEVVSSNSELTVDVPVDATLPYSVITAGGTTAGPSVLTGISATAVHGTPADAGKASANASQTIQLIGTDLNAADQVILGIVDANGSWSPKVVAPANIATDHTAMTIQLPATVDTGYIGLLGGKEQFWLQIVPHITSYAAPTTPGTFGKYSGSGFMEGGMTAVVGSTSYPDGGAGSGDGIDVTGNNSYFSITTGHDDTQSVYVITVGGTSETYTPAPK
jgi:hypothetical protein